MHQPMSWVLSGLMLTGSLGIVLSPAAVRAATVDAKDLNEQARDAVAQSLYAASATIEAVKRSSEARFAVQRQQIEQLQGNLKAAGGQSAKLQAELRHAQERFVADLAERDRAYAREIALFRGTVQSIASTEDGAAALRRYNAGDRKGALAVLDKLDDAADKALQVRTDVQKAVGRRNTAALALDARTKGDVSTQEVIARYEAVTKLDPGLHPDWVVLARLYADIGQLGQAKLAAQHASETATDDRDQAVAIHEIGKIQRTQGNLAGALQSFQAALAIVQKLTSTDSSNTLWQRDLSVSHAQIGQTLSAQGNLAGALQSFQVAMAITQKLISADPSDAQRQSDVSFILIQIGDTLIIQGNLASALQSFQASMVIRQKLATAEPSNTQRQCDIGISHERIGRAQILQGDLAGALKSFQRKKAIAQKLVSTDPSNSQWQRDLGISHIKIGDTLSAQDDLAGAMQSYKAAMIIAHQLAVADPSNTEWQYDLSISNERIGIVQSSRGDLVGAIKSFQTKRAIAQKLISADPSNNQWKSDLSISLDRIGTIQSIQRDLAGAMRSFQAAMALRQRLASIDPSNAEWQRDLSISHEKLGDTFSDLGNLVDALQNYRDAFAIRRKLASAVPSNTEWQRDLWAAMWRLVAYSDSGVTWPQVVKVMEDMQSRGVLLPSDFQYLDEARRLAKGASTP